MKRNKSTTELHGAHSGIRKGTPEYNDGANIDINGGNDDYPERNMIRNAFFSGPENPDADVGKVAYGNKLKESDDQDDSEETSQTQLTTGDEAHDKASAESSPATNPPGHRSKSTVDRDSHRAG